MSVSLMMKLLLLSLLLFFSCAKTSSYRQDVSQEKVKLCFIGDTGTGKPVQGRVAEMLAKENCDTIHFVGDIIYPDGITSKYDKEFKEKFLKYYGPIAEKTPLYMIMGNHDHRTSIEPWHQIAKDYPNIKFPYPYYLLKVRDLCLVHLDSSYYKLLSNFFVAQAQANWLGRLKDELKDCRIKMALTHHPYKSSGDRHGDSTGWWKQFVEGNIIGKFDYMISGHEHILADEGAVDGTRLLISGAGGNTTREEDGGYLVMVYENGQLTYEFKTVGPRRI